jgi:predicted DNA-binding transcriptional regulator YafY
MSFSKATQLLQLARMASGRIGVTLNDIEREFECVRRTAQRMSQALEDVFPDTEVYTDHEGRKRWRVPQVKAAEFFAPTADQLAALELATRSAERSGLVQEARQLEGLQDTIKLLISSRRRVGLETDQDALLEAMGHAARPGPRPVSDNEIDIEIAEALKGPCELVIRYKGRRDEVASERRLQPYGILLGGRRYLVAKDPAKADGRLRHFRIEDIISARVTDRIFDRDEAFDLASYAARSFGAFQNETEFVETVWRFAPAAAQQASRFEFHPDQVQEMQDDGSLIVRFTASGHLEMCWHLYAWGDQVEVLEPPALAALVNPYRRSDFPSLP